MRFIVPILLLVALAGCQSNGSNEPAPERAENPTTTMQASYYEGPVVETMDAGGYTYVLVDTGEEKVWAAGPPQEMAVGTEVKISRAMPMQDFHSSALERDFDLLYFVNDFGTGAPAPQAMGGHGDAMGGHGGAMGGHGSGMGASPEAEVDLTGITPADHTVAAVYRDKAGLAGETVRVRGKVVKSLTGIMGTNWLHVQDGTGGDGENDLTVTTSSTAPVGATVLIEGRVTVDKDFGAGYKYAVIVEDATVTIE